MKNFLLYCATIFGITFGYYFHKEGCKYWIAILGFTIGTLIGTLISQFIKYLIIEDIKYLFPH